MSVYFCKASQIAHYISISQFCLHFALNLISRNREFPPGMILFDVTRRMMGKKNKKHTHTHTFTVCQQKFHLFTPRPGNKRLSLHVANPSHFSLHSVTLKKETAALDAFIKLMFKNVPRFFFTSI